MVNVTEVLTISAIFLGIIFFILLIIAILIPPKRRHSPEKPRVKEDLRKIKEQINGEKEI